jgi:3-deoxy-D-manno-octulosonate 8-phosphate phosphatase KdsC-like HAD superfamily phosphatase
MQTLKDRINDLKLNSVARIPKDFRLIMQSCTEDLSKSGILERTVQKGDTFPDARLMNSQGLPVTPTSYLCREYTVVTFYRGIW